MISRWGRPIHPRELDKEEVTWRGHSFQGITIPSDGQPFSNPIHVDGIGWVGVIAKIDKETLELKHEKDLGNMQRSFREGQVAERYQSLMRSVRASAATKIDAIETLVRGAANGLGSFVENEQGELERKPLTFIEQEEDAKEEAKSKKRRKKADAAALQRHHTRRRRCLRLPGRARHSD